MNLNTIKWFGESMLYGDKYIYQTVPRLLTLWLDMAEQQMNAPENKELSKATVFLSKHVHEAPAYKVCLLMVYAVRPLMHRFSGILHSRNWCLA